MLLGIDTSTRYAGVGLWTGDRVVSALCWHSMHNHTAELMPAVQHVLDRAKVGVTCLEAIAVALGPGGFSALRVGISVAKGLALSLRIPIVGVGTLEAEAYPFAALGLPIRPLLDVGKDAVATAVFRRAGSRWRKLEGERLCTPEELVDSISRRTVLCGEGVPNRTEYLRSALGRKGVVVGFHSPTSRLWALSALARDRLGDGDVSLAALQPLYLRAPSIGPAKTPQKVAR